ncbi:MAG TPA: hypothetical protein VF188_17085 [Longimicrobiales bacterium]
MTPASSFAGSGVGDPRAASDSITPTTPTVDVEDERSREFCTLNILSAFGKDLPVDEIHALARDCVSIRKRESERFNAWNREILERLSAVADPSERMALAPELAHLLGWDRDMLSTIHQGGRGCIVCSFHFGAYRYIPVDLALLGLSVLQPLEAAVFRNRSRRLDGADPILRDRLRVVDVESRGRTASLAMVRTLRRGGVVVVYVDGNTGADGVWGDSGRVSILFLGFRILVKNGIARLSLLTGAPIVPIVTPRTADGAGHVICGAPIWPEGRRTGPGDEAAVREIMAAAYRFLEMHVRRQPEQWESWSHLHRWRVPSNVSGHPTEVQDPNAITADLERGVTFVLDRRRVVRTLDRSGRPVWVDAHTLRSIRPPIDMQDIMEMLWAPSGLDSDALTATADTPTRRERLVRVLAELKARGMVKARHTRSTVFGDHRYGSVGRRY